MKEEPPEDAEGIENLRTLAGTTLAHYQIGPVVGIGTSGLVFKAKDTKDDREIALKVYTPEFAEDDEARNRFIRAARTMMPMRHSNLVTLYGAGKTGPYCWMAMDYVEGENLKETITRIGTKGKLDWRPALRMSIDIGRGLYYIHGENIIHRSLSPGNLLVSKVGTVKLGSLILAKALSGALSKDVTVSGNFLGEVSYLSPEQVGAGGSVDQRSDIYSFGALMYALLTGKPPHVGKNPLETATWIIRRELVSPRKADPNIPQPLEKIVVKMLQKNPADRYQTAGELLAELESLPLA
jgi:serine/threonine-protein kinase